MDRVAKDLSQFVAKGIVIYKYDFTNDKGYHVQSAKVLFDIYGLMVYVNCPKYFDKPIGAVVIADVQYDGKQWLVK